MDKLNWNFVCFLFSKSTIYSNNNHKIVHRCGAGGGVRACHADGHGFDHRLGLVSWGFSSPLRQISGSFRPSGSPNIIWPS